MADSNDVKTSVDTALRKAEDFISLNQVDEAIKALQHAVKDYTPLSDCLEITPILDALGRLHVEAGEMKDAQHYYCRSLLAKQKEFGLVSRELAVAYRNVASCSTDENSRKSALAQAETMELPEAEFQFLKQSLLGDDELDVLKTGV